MLPIGISYHSDLQKARDLMLAALLSLSRSSDLKPSRRLVGSGDNAVNLDLRV
jgi:small-conductance mechanosensitive channel